MGLLDEIMQAQAAPTRQCKTGRLIAELPKADAADLKAALDNPAMQTAAIIQVLNARGHHVSSSQMSTHRRGECCCVISG